MRFMTNEPPSGLYAMLERLSLEPTYVAAEHPILGSFWGDPEAGLIGSRLYHRADTPLHSVLHEACHFVCMDAGRRAALHTNISHEDPRGDELAMGCEGRAGGPKTPQ